VYDEAFFHAAQQQELAISSARAMLGPLLREFTPQSVVDVGCGSGGWARVALDAGIADVVAIDGDFVDRTALQIPVDRFQPLDLREPLKLDRRFDLVVCMEVAEHLPEERGPGLIDDLCALADLVLFSAAVPGQGGVAHLNLRWQSYWAELFGTRGFGVTDIRPRYWRDAPIAWWYRQNAMLARRGGRNDVILDCVHPDLWLGALAQPSLRTAVGVAGAAFKRAVGRRLRKPGARKRPH
jgi:SAM-dependent methyltransferase